MKNTWFEDLKSQVEAFLDTATDEELYRALRKANYEHYMNVTGEILVIYEDSDLSFNLNEPVHVEKGRRTDIVDNSKFGLSNISTADDYNYCIAA